MAHRLGVVGVVLIATLVASRSEAAEPTVRPGIEVLLSNFAQELLGKRVGILTNQTGVNRAGKSDVDLLLAEGIHLVAIFSPEHGFRGELDRESVEDAIDPTTGLPIHSLYGAVRAPTREMLAPLDVLLVDLQDIGGRPYTYISTTLLTLQAAAAAGRHVIVLDRPNPIGGTLVQGPVLDMAFSSFVGSLPVPLRHGLTLGEMARFGNDLLGLHAALLIIPAEGWRRNAWFDQTGLPWIAPSPNIPDIESASHYPGLVLFESTNLSVGRGTPIAFQMIGAPWLQPRHLIGQIGPVAGIELTETAVVPHSPGDGKYDGREIRAIRLRVTDRAAYDPTRLAVMLLSRLRSAYGSVLKIDAEGFDQRAGSDQLRVGLERNNSPEFIWRGWRAEISRFLKARQPYLLYR